MRRVALLLLAVTFTTAALVASLVSPKAGADLTEGVSPHGTGETLLLVVASNPDSPADALAGQEGVNTRFGDLQGFSVDAAENYAVTGALVQTTPDAEGVECPASDETFETAVDAVPLDLECPNGLAGLSVLLPVGLQYVPADDYDAFAFPAPCGAIGQPPCQRERYDAMLDDELAFRAGWLVATAFRTKRGAEEFMELARSAGVTNLLVVQARKLGGPDMGLGQEPHPDGSGPLTGPLEDQERHQR